MYKKLLLPALLLLSFALHAQNKAVIKGRIVDSLANTPMEFATVAVLDMRDTSSKLISYTLSDKNGDFSLHNLPRGIPVKIYISFVAYQPYRKLFTFDKTNELDLGTIRLNIKQLQQVNIIGERMPISIRKDTIEFNAEAFKVKPNAVVQDLLKKLPGVEVANDGGITVMGKQVTKVLVDGKEFFPSDLRIATRNLDADMIAKVQVYDDRENDPDHLIPQSRVNKIINLKFKKELKKSIFGKVYAGAGTQNHYQSAGLINMFRDTLQISVLGASNNLNSTGFDFNDLYQSGGLNRGGEAISRSGLAFGGRGGGKQTATNAGININTDYGKKLKINLAYIYRHSNTSYNSITNRQQFLGDTTAVTSSAAGSTGNIDVHSISATVAWKPSTATQIRYTPLVNITQNNQLNNSSANSYSNFVNPINNSVNSSTSMGNTFQLQQSFNYNHQLKKKGASVNVDHYLYINPSSNTLFDNSSLTSYVNTFPSYAFRQRGDNQHNNNEASVSAGIRYPVTKKLTADITASADYGNQLDKVSTYDYNPVTGQYDSFLLIKSSDLTRNKWTETISPGITYTFPKEIELRAHLTTQYQQVNNIFRRDVNNIDQHYVFFLPNVSLNVKGFSTGYNRSVNLPNIGDMIPYTVVFSPLYSVTGNPNLKPATRNNYNMGYSKYNYQKGLSFNLSANASFEQNSIFRQRTLDAQLAETSTPINRNGTYNYGFNGYISKQIKKKDDFSLSLTTSYNLSKGHIFFVLNYVNGYQNSYQGSVSERLSLNYKDIIEIDPQYQIAKTYTTYGGVDYNTQNYITHSISTQFSVNMPAKFNIDGTYNYFYNPLLPAGFQKSSNLLNVSLAHQFLKKDRGEIKLSCYDILNQNVSLSRSIYENSIVDTQSQIIRRYFMLTLQFKFNKSTVKEDPKKKDMPIIKYPTGRM